MRGERADGGAQRGDAAAPGAGHPAPQEFRCGALVGEAVELGEVVREQSGAMNTAIGMTQASESRGPSLGVRARGPVQVAAQPLDRLVLFAGQDSPFLLVHSIDTIVERFGEMEAIDDERGIRAMVLDRVGIVGADIAAGPMNLVPLVLARSFAETRVDGCAALSGPHPHCRGVLEVVEQGGELAPFAVGDLVSLESDVAAGAVSVTSGGDAAVRQARERRAGHAQNLGARLLRHGVAEHRDAPLELIGIARITGRRQDLLVDSAKRRAFDPPGQNHSRILSSRMVSSSQLYPTFRLTTMVSQRQHCRRRQPFL